LQMLHLDVSKVYRVLHIGTRMGSGRGHKQSPRAVWRHGQHPGSAGDVRGHAGGDMLARASAARGRGRAALALVFLKCIVVRFPKVAQGVLIILSGC